ncbi:hypothetical protein [Nostoc sp. 106C]|uniref:hypothetical protein n=1 Tax=Nostoc sp. 106C TaxID=1932667 RepID=UPI000A370AF0|nr:hypothetical protein [Nostoc sp. 106C]OUL22824.1 hypothetical protein BV378_23185 [Nostoc sp. RF31YmG]OUL26962.1 hypothetical protein BV375_19945 [Nostoc sp. 106C]
MRSQHESQVFSAVIKDCLIQGEYLIESSSKIFSPTGMGEVISWDKISFAKLSVCRSFFDGSYNVQKQTYDNWVLSNNQSCLLTPLIANPQVTLISQAKFDQLYDEHSQRWSIFYWLTRPGFSQDFSQALVQIMAHCPAGPPQYGSLLYLERTGKEWEVKSSYGLYNQ